MADRCGGGKGVKVKGAEMKEQLKTMPARESDTEAAQSRIWREDMTGVIIRDPTPEELEQMRAPKEKK